MKKLLGLFMFLLLSFVLSACADSKETTKETTIKDKEVPTMNKKDIVSTYEITSQKTNKTESVTISLKSVKEVTEKKDIEYLKENVTMFPKQGPTYLIVEYEITNHADRHFAFPDSQLELLSEKTSENRLKTFLGNAQPSLDVYNGNEVVFDETNLFHKRYVDAGETMNGTFILAGYDEFNFRDYDKFYINWHIPVKWVSDNQTENAEVFWEVSVK